MKICIYICNGSLTSRQHLNAISYDWYHKNANTHANKVVSKKSPFHILLFNSDGFSPHTHLPFVSFPASRVYFLFFLRYWRITEQARGGSVFMQIFSDRTGNFDCLRRLASPVALFDRSKVPTRLRVRDYLDESYKGTKR